MSTAVRIPETAAKNGLMNAIVRVISRLDRSWTRPLRTDCALPTATSVCETPPDHLLASTMTLIARFLCGNLTSARSSRIRLPCRCIFVRRSWPWSAHRRDINHEANTPQPRSIQLHPALEAPGAAQHRLRSSGHFPKGMKGIKRTAFGRSGKG